MEGHQLAGALQAFLAHQPKHNEIFGKAIQSWAKALSKSCTLEDLRAMHASAGVAFVAWFSRSLADTEIAKLIKKFDPHLPAAKDDKAKAFRDHLEKLASGIAQPSPKPSPTKQNKSANKRPASEIITLTSPLQRRMELEKLTPTELKAAIKQMKLDTSPLSDRPSKTELIEYIQQSIASGYAEPTIFDDR